MIYTRSLAAVFTTLILLLLCAACSTTPVGVSTGSAPEAVQRELNANALNAGKPSEWSRQVLHRNNLYERYAEDPAATLDVLHKRMQEFSTPERLFALAELSFLYAEQVDQRSYYLAAAAYAYAFLLPENEQTSLVPIDPRGRVAVDLYNVSVARAFTSAAHEVVLEPGTYTLPFGEVMLTTEPSQFEWSGYRFKRFVPVGEYLVRGLRNRYRQYGAGAPLAAELEPLGSGAAAETARRRIPPRTRVPVTAFVRFDDPLRSLKEGALQAHLELYAADQTRSVRVGTREVPLELDTTAALALQLEGAPIWNFEFAGFRFAEEKVLGDGLAMLAPYRPGRIPVVFVHGTASSPARWAEMFNELSNDPVIGSRYQFWLYQYNTGQPILYSAYLMRRAIQATRAELDPKLEDDALRHMVIVGHSQGGLLAKLMAVHSGTRFWDAATDVSLSDVEAPAELKTMLQQGMFFDPLAGVDRVVFIATPHHGSYRANGLARRLVRRIVRAPRTFEESRSALAQLGLSEIPTSVDNMSPNHHMVRTLAELPIDPHIKANSIIPVKNPGPPRGQNDGVVTYESAHIEGVESELVVHSLHSTQAHPETIEEVRRILRAQVAQEERLTNRTRATSIDGDQKATSPH
jgi:pimeloyl-ACP methyl ester carboxylesterase